jgi:hypothetical protein
VTREEKIATARLMDRARMMAAEVCAELRRKSGLDLTAVATLEPSGPVITISERTPTGAVVRRQWTPEEARDVCAESKLGRPHEIEPYAPPPPPERGTQPADVRRWMAEWNSTGRVPTWTPSGA